MEYVVPYYYKEFKCIANECPDTCCAGWGIQIDKKSLKKYAELNTPFGTRLRNSIDWDEESFVQSNRRCAFLNEDNLCDMVLEAGEKCLCKTCRRYPRHYEEFENVREISLSLSCPVAADMILFREEPVTFERYQKERGEEEYEYFDFLLFTKLEEIREVVIGLYQDRTIPIKERFALSVALLHDIQKRIAGQRLYEVDDLLEQLKQGFLLKKAHKKWNDSYRRKLVMEKMFSLLYRFEHLDPEWESYLNESKNVLYGAFETSYEEDWAAFEKEEEKEAILYEQLAVYFFFTYFCGAVYDEDAYGKLLMTMAFVQFVKELYFARWRQAKTLTKQDRKDIARRLAKEIEHSDPNLELMEKEMNENPDFSMESFFEILLS